MSVTYKAPLRDMEFVYYELLGGQDINQLPGYEDAEPDTIKAILEEAAKFAETVFLPLNQSGDEQACQLNDCVVTVPDGFKDAYDQFCEGGWTALTEDPIYGGMGLPYSVSVMMSEMLSATNQSLAMYAGLTHGAAKAIHACGSDEQRKTYLPKFADGSWSGTMCLTEAQCGTDLGLIQTKAIPNEKGSHNLTGTKIFISAGEHELTDNIIHLVLARLPDAPPGIKGISLFLVPKYLFDADCNIGDRNPVTCGAIEHKMGIKGSATCVINMDDAEGYMIGTEHKGMQAMFVMMNSARLGTGIQGLAAGEQAYQGAVEYARDRVQMRSLTGVKYPDKKADPIIVHPDVRRMLLTIRAYTEGCRAMTYWIAQELDQFAKNPDADRREEADDFASLLTPVIKAFCSDTGFDSTNLGVQVYGGHGYISEHGMEQFVRDARIAQLYEGTNGIQALDLVGRKMAMHNGRLVKRFFTKIGEFIAQENQNESLAEFIKPLVNSFSHLQQATGWIAKHAAKNPDHAGGASVDFLRIFGLVTVGYMWVRMVKIAQENQQGSDAHFYKAKIKTGRFYMQKLLPQTSSLLASIEAGSDSLMEFDEAYF
ncbi:MAG: acyl-CoA dehydrogenase [Gammaproteobacteria bacterium]|nr:MAG: acyl-CoA dehydrogenase [Gammaproteobacteria bacterium]